MTATVHRVHRAPHTGAAGFPSSQPDSLWSCGPYAVSTPKSHEDSLWRELSLPVDHPACRRWRAEPEFPHLPPGLSAGPRSGSACIPTLLLFCATWVMQRATASPGQRSQDKRATTSPARPVPPPVQPPTAPSLLCPPENRPPPRHLSPQGSSWTLFSSSKATQFPFPYLAPSSLYREGSQPPTLALHLFLMVNSQKYYLLCISLKVSSQGKLLIQLRPRH